MINIIGFIIAIVLIIVVSRKSLWVALHLAAVVIGLFNLAVPKVISVIRGTYADLSIICLALAVGMIPLIGGAMEESGILAGFAENLRIRKNLFLLLTPAMIGMLPVPGGALLSAPLVLRVGKDLAAKKQAAINIWFRHWFLLIYPLGSLLATTKMAGLNLYVVILYLIPAFVLMSLIGGIFWLRGIKGTVQHKGPVQLKKLVIPVTIIVAAPLTHVTLRKFFPQVISELLLMSSVMLSLFLALWLGRIDWTKLKNVARKMRPGKFVLLIMGIFLFLNMFKASPVAKMIATYAFSRTFLLVGAGALLGFLTGRVMIPLSILLPIYDVQFGLETLDSLAFSIMFFSTFIGYIISPVHPCVLVSLEYFGINMKQFMTTLAVPSLLCLTAALAAALVLL